ncbi:MAG: FtsQ-type POTRA domain-containing protein, partial [Gemmatimonadaceae bacterium]
PWWGPPLLRPLAFFRVKHVEVRGTRYAPPSDVAKALGVDTMWSLWDDTDVLERRVRALPHVREAEVSRRIPSTLVVTVEENIPIALVPGTDGFHAYDEDGRALTLDPSRTPVDLPIIAKRDTTLLRLLGEVRASDPSLFARISEVRRNGRDELVMQLVTVPVRAMVDVTVEQLAQIAPVEEDLLKRRARPVELDLRFKDQVIARIQ